MHNKQFHCSSCKKKLKREECNNRRGRLEILCINCLKKSNNRTNSISHLIEKIINQTDKHYKSNKK